MKLKFKPIQLESGRPIAFISSAFAKKFNIIEGSRIEILCKKTKLILAVNLVEKLLKENEISFSQEAASRLKIKKGAKVEVSLALEPHSTRLVLKKLDKKELTRKEIFSVVKDIVNNALNEAEIAYFVSGVYHGGMSFNETVYLTEAIAKTGNILKWKEKKIADKHSIGGVPGNRTTPIVISICAAAGIKIPKTSSRAITSAAGTADTLETVTNVALSEKKLREVVEKTNACLAWGGSLGLAPADDKLIRVEHLLNLDPEPQLIASIIAKKLSVGSSHILIDIPYGAGAKVSRAKALNLKKKFLKIGKQFKLKIKVVLTPGSEPIGNGVGPVLEMQDVLKVLKRKNSPKDLEEKSVFLASQILEMMGKAKPGQGKKLAQEILDSGNAFKKFEQIISAQGKKKTKLEPARFKHVIKAKAGGKIRAINNKQINLLARILGCPTTPSAGIYLYRHCGNKIKKGEKLAALYSDSEKKLKESVSFFSKEKPIHL